MVNFRMISEKEKIYLSNQNWAGLITSMLVKKGLVQESLFFNKEPRSVILAFLRIDLFQGAKESSKDFLKKCQELLWDVMMSSCSNIRFQRQFLKDGKPFHTKLKNKFQATKNFSQLLSKWE